MYGKIVSMLYTSAWFWSLSKVGALNSWQFPYSVFTDYFHKFIEDIQGVLNIRFQFKCVPVNQIIIKHVFNIIEFAVK